MKALLNRKILGFASKRKHAETDEPLIVFMHVPKAGGMSVTRLLKEVYGDRMMVAHPMRGWPQEWSNETLELIAEKRNYFAAVSGHFTYGIHELFKRPARYFTTVRNPMARLESYYNFVKRWEIHHHHAKANSLEIEDFFQWMVDSDDIELGNLQCLLIAGEKSFSLAKARIEDHFDFAIPIERFGHALPVLARAYNWPHLLQEPRENTTRHASKLSQLPPNLFDALVQANAEDQKLHDYCERRWAEIALADTA